MLSCVFAHPGLQILYTLLQNVAQEEAAAQSFYQTYFCDILQHIFSVVTDTSHTAGEFTQMTTEGTLTSQKLNSERRYYTQYNVRGENSV